MKNLNRKSFASFILLAIVIVFFSSCSLHLEKRRYNPGYHVELLKPNKNVPSSKQKKESPIQLVKNKFVPLQLDNDSIPTLKISDQPIIQKTKKQHIRPALLNKKHVLDNDSCDVVYMVTGERINAIVIEIGEDYVHYKKCDDPKGRLYTVKTKTIDNITLRNGEYFIPKDRVVIDKDKEKRKSNTLFVLSIIGGAIALISLLLSFFIYPYSVVAFSLAFVDIIYTFILMMVNIRPSRYIPSYRTKFTWIICSIVLAILLAAFIIMFI